MTTTCITGANRGIGLELARQCKARGDDVVAIVRTSSPALDALDARVLTGVDAADEGALRRAAQELAGTSIDVLICNAGVMVADDLDSARPDDVVRQFQVNALGPVLCVRALRPLLRAGHAKVALITSRMGSIDDNTSGRMYGYRMSKAALNMAGKSLALDLAKDGVAVVILHPGPVRTEMTGGHGQIDADEAARGVLARIDALHASTSGRFLHGNGQQLPW